MRNLEFFEDLENMRNCPIEVTLNIIGKKWAINIIRDLFKGKTRFSEFLDSNPQLSTKMLSLRLKELQKSDIIKKTIKSTTPVIIEYCLTQQGKNLNKILFQLAEFSLKNYPNKVYNQISNATEDDISSLKKFFRADGIHPI